MASYKWNQPVYKTPCHKKKRKNCQVGPPYQTSNAPSEILHQNHSYGERSSIFAHANEPYSERYSHDSKGKAGLHCLLIFSGPRVKEMVNSTISSPIKNKESQSWKVRYVKFSVMGVESDFTWDANNRRRHNNRGMWKVVPRSWICLLHCERALVAIMVA